MEMRMPRFGDLGVADVTTYIRVHAALLLLELSWLVLPYGVIHTLFFTCSLLLLGLVVLVMLGQSNMQYARNRQWGWWYALPFLIGFVAFEYGWTVSWMVWTFILTLQVWKKWVGDREIQRLDHSYTSPRGGF